MSPNEPLCEFVGCMNPARHDLMINVQGGVALKARVCKECKLGVIDELYAVSSRLNAIGSRGTTMNKEDLYKLCATVGRAAAGDIGWAHVDTDIPAEGGTVHTASSAIAALIVGALGLLEDRRALQDEVAYLRKAHDDHDYGSGDPVPHSYAQLFSERTIVGIDFARLADCDLERGRHGENATEDPLVS